MTTATTPRVTGPLRVAPHRSSDATDADTECLDLTDGRRLAFARYGDRAGRPLVVLHGFPGSRLQAAFLDDKARRAGVCLIAPDRPGFGRSTHAPQRTLCSGARDVARLADHLGHARFDVMGISCGGAHALACAHELPQRVGRVILMAGMGPMDLPAIRDGQLPVLKAMFALARRHPALVSPMLALDRALYRRDPQRAVKMVAGMLSAPDRRLLADQPRVAELFGASLAEAYRPGLRGAMREAHLIGSRRDHALSRIEVPVDVHQGAWDRHVPPAMGRYLAAVLPNARLHAYDDEGHLSIVWNRFEQAVEAMAR